MWVAFAHIAIFALIMFASMLLKDKHPQRDAMLVSIAVGVIVIVIYVGPFGLLTAGSAGLVGYGFSRTI